ncbi:hypothetical protein F7725_007519 [Dissostichus mawsoni]|uniref:Uncharacterized protein n=1 Tax=Dissostichus mawsoni TaxID=36200 RepID=A0A7J5Y4M5_DISMA|nr:hypothetical protein F7725_007519 [Dissostichus mawsoni]
MATLAADTLIHAHILNAHAHIKLGMPFEVIYPDHILIKHHKNLGIVSLREFFVHVNNHLKKHETICCVFEGCSFSTNIYGTYQSHKNRKHKTHTLNNFKAGIVEAEFARITTVPLRSKFMQQLDHHSSKLLRIFHKKGGAAGQKIRNIMAEYDKLYYLSMQ